MAKKKQQQGGGGNAGRATSSTSGPTPPPPAAVQAFSNTETKTTIRVTLLFFCTVYFVAKAFGLSEALLPYGTAQSYAPWRKEQSYMQVDSKEDSLRSKYGRTKRIYERGGGDDTGEKLMKGPETIVFGPDGTMYALSEDAKLLSVTDIRPVPGSDLDMTADVTVVKNLGVGRPLGGKFTADGTTLYIADALLGLTRLRHPHDPKSRVELVASSYEDGGGNEIPIHYADDVCIGPKTGLVYFTDASDIPPGRVHPAKNTWDTLYASKLDMARGLPGGKLFSYDPETDEVKLLAGGIHFANGVAVDENEEYIVLADTFGIRILRYNLTGEKRGQLDVVVDSDQMVGYPDGTDCTWPSSSPSSGGDDGEDGGGTKTQRTKCYAVFPSSIVPIHSLYKAMPDALDSLLRTLILMLPKTMAPKIKKYGGVIEFDPAAAGGGGESTSPSAPSYIQDPDGQEISLLTGVTVHDGKLYLGSLKNDYIGVYDLVQGRDE